MIISIDFTGKKFSVDKLTSFFAYTQNEGDDDIDSNSILKIQMALKCCMLFE